MPMTPFIGVRISWLMLARNSDLRRADFERLVARLGELGLHLLALGDVGDDADQQRARPPASHTPRLARDHPPFASVGIVSTHSSCWLATPSSSTMRSSPSQKLSAMAAWEEVVVRFAQHGLARAAGEGAPGVVDEETRRCCASLTNRGLGTASRIRSSRRLTMGIRGPIRPTTTTRGYGLSIGASAAALQIGRAPGCYTAPSMSRPVRVVVLALAAFTLGAAPGDVGFAVVRPDGRLQPLARLEGENWSPLAPADAAGDWSLWLFDDPVVKTSPFAAARGAADFRRRRRRPRARRWRVSRRRRCRRGRARPPLRLVSASPCGAPTSGPSCPSRSRPRARSDASSRPALPRPSIAPRTRR